MGKQTFYRFTICFEVIVWEHMLSRPLKLRTTINLKPVKLLAQQFFDWLHAVFHKLNEMSSITAT